MKETTDVVACFVDYGVFLPWAEKLAETMKRVFYYTPWEWEFIDIENTAIGKGLVNLRRLDDFMEPRMLKEIDLFIFPDVLYAGHQKHLRDLGKAVWGSMGADELELYRTDFINVLKRLKLPVSPSIFIYGLDDLSDHLKKVKDKYIKIDRYRGVMETWHHIDYDHSIRDLECLGIRLGPLRNDVTFVVQDPIENAKEIGYDGWSIDGDYPSRSFQGYECKNECYLGSVLHVNELPEGVRMVNEAMAPILRNYGYRNRVSTEIRQQNTKAYYIDPTLRTPGLTGDHETECCQNLADIFWYGANGIMVEPEYIATFAGNCNVRHTGDPNLWRSVRIPEDVRRWFKAEHYTERDGMLHFPPRHSPELGVSPSSNQELGVLVGIGDSPEEVFDHIKENVDKLRGEPIDVSVDGMIGLLLQIKEAQDEGMKFSSRPIPKPESAAKLLYR